MKEIKEKFFNIIKRRWWYFVLVILSSVYVFFYRGEIYQLSELNAQNLIFILWLVLLILPLFSEIEIGSVKLKKEIEQTRSEVKESVNELRLQIMDLKISNSNTVVVNSPLATKEELSALEKGIESSGQEFLGQSEELSLNTSADSIFLFQVRLTLEKMLSTLCEKYGYWGQRSMHKMVQYLAKKEVVDGNAIGLIQEIVKIANRGVHGEMVNEEYIDFVKKMFPTVKYALERAEQNIGHGYVKQYDTYQDDIHDNII